MLSFAIEGLRLPALNFALRNMLRQSQNKMIGLESIHCRRRFFFPIDTIINGEKSKNIINFNP